MSMQTKRFFRVSDLDGRGLWYDRSGDFTGRIHKELSFCKSNNILMPYDKEIVGWLSATDSTKQLMEWFDLNDIKKLAKFGFSVVEYETKHYKLYANHWVIDPDAKIIHHDLQLDL